MNSFGWQLLNSVRRRIRGGATSSDGNHAVECRISDVIFQSEAMPSNRPPLTSQAQVWASDREAHLIAYLKNPQGTNLEPPHRFIIQDPLLKMLLIPGAPVPSGFPKIGAWTIGKRKSGSLLTWFVQRALDLRRLPFCEDRLLTEMIFDNEEVEQIIKALTPAQVVSTTNEVRELYKHTQAQLAAKGLKKVSLRRHLRDNAQDRHAYGFQERETSAGELVRLRLAAFALGCSTIQLDMDTLNSWGDDGGYGHFPVHLHALIPAEDVLYAAELVEQTSNQESGEWVIINRSPSGIVEFPVSDIEVPGLPLDTDAVKREFRVSSPQAFWDKYQPLKFRAGQSGACSPTHQPNLQMPATQTKGVSFLRKLFGGHRIEKNSQSR